VFVVDAHPGRLAIALRPRGALWLETDMRQIRDAGVSLLVSALELEEMMELELFEEADVAERLGLTYLAAPMPHGGVPTMATIASVVPQMVDVVKTGRLVAVHCRSGIGRSSLIVGCALASMGTAPDIAWTRVGAARGKQVPDTVEQREWLYGFASTLKRTATPRPGMI
jgi:protein-tyrosine phosphatase